MGGVSGEGHVEGGLVPQRRRMNASADEEAGTAAEEHPHHHQHPDRRQVRAGLTDRRVDMSHSPEVPESVDGQSSHAAAGPTAVLVGAAAASRPTLASANSS